MSHGPTPSCRSLLVGTTLGAPLAVGLASAPADAHDHHELRGGNAPGSPAALAFGWHLLTEAALAAAAFPEPITQTRAWAVSWLAGSRATRGQVGD